MTTKLWATILIHEVPGGLGVWAEIAIFPSKRDATKGTGCKWLTTSQGKYSSRCAGMRSAQCLCRRLGAQVVETGEA